MWIEAVSARTTDVTFAPPAEPGAIASCEQALGHPLPRPLTELLRETNGITDRYETGLIWPVERIQADNLAFRTSEAFAEIYMPFEALLFFADAGNGDQFAFVRRDGRPDIFGWNHENDSRTWVAPGLLRYLEWWLDGKIEF